MTSIRFSRPGGGRTGLRAAPWNRLAGRGRRRREPLAPPSARAGSGGVACSPDVPRDAQRPTAQAKGGEGGGLSCAQRLAGQWGEALVRVAGQSEAGGLNGDQSRRGGRARRGRGGAGSSCGWQRRGRRGRRTGERRAGGGGDPRSWGGFPTPLRSGAGGGVETLRGLRGAKGFPLHNSPAGQARWADPPSPAPSLDPSGRPARDPRWTRGGGLLPSSPRRGAPAWPEPARRPRGALRLPEAAPAEGGGREASPASQQPAILAGETGRQTAPKPRSRSAGPWGGRRPKPARSPPRDPALGKETRDLQAEKMRRS